MFNWLAPAETIDFEDDESAELRGPNGAELGPEREDYDHEEPGTLSGYRSEGLDLDAVARQVALRRKLHQRDALRFVAMHCRSQGIIADELEDILADPAVYALWEGGEQKMRDAYRMQAHYQSPAPPMPDELREATRARVRMAVADHEDFGTLNLTGADLSDMQPALGDRVWFVSEPGPLAQRRGYVVAVLEREPSEQPARLSVAGRMTIHASEGLELRSNKQLILQGDEVQVRGRLGRVLLDECSTVLRSLFTHATKATFVGEVIETLAERISTHSKTTHRTVDGVDQLEAGTIHYRASESAQIGAEHTLITGGEIVKVEGSQIHLG